MDDLDLTNMNQTLTLQIANHYPRSHVPVSWTLSTLPDLPTTHYHPKPNRGGHDLVFPSPSVASLQVTLLKQKQPICQHILPFNYVIVVKNGLKFVTRTTQLRVEWWITNALWHNQTPSHTLLLLDLKNMFNKVSRKEFFEIIHKVFTTPSQLPLCYTMAMIFPAQNGNSNWTTIPIKEGIDQECPLSSNLATIVLHSTLPLLTNATMPQQTLF